LRTRSGLRVPTLAEVLERHETQSITSFIDLKQNLNTLAALDGVLTGGRRWEKVILDFENFFEAINVKAARPDWCVVVSPLLPFLLAETVVACGVDGVDIYFPAMTRRAADRLARHAMVRTCWFTSDPRTARRVLSRDVDGLMTNRPDRLLAVGLPPQRQKTRTAIDFANGAADE